MQGFISTFLTCTLLEEVGGVEVKCGVRERERDCEIEWREGVPEGASQQPFLLEQHSSLPLSQTGSQVGNRNHVVTCGIQHRTFPPKVAQVLQETFDALWRICITRNTAYLKLPPSSSLFIRHSWFFICSLLSRSRVSLRRCG